MNLMNKGPLYQFDVVIPQILRSVEDDNKNYWLTRRTTVPSHYILT